MHMQKGKWIGICGELGADLELTEEFLKMGLDELVCISGTCIATEKEDQRVRISY